MSFFSPIAEMLVGSSGRARGGAENPSNPLEPSDWGGIGYGSNSDAGVNVSRRTALMYSAIWRGTRLKSSDVGKLPLVIYRRVGKGKERAIEHKAYRLLRWKPNSETTAFVFKQTLEAHRILQGNGYAYIFRNGDASPRELVQLLPDHTWPVRENGQLMYVTEYMVDGRWERRKLLKENVLHIKGLGYDGLTGYSFIEYGVNSIGLGVAAQRYGSKFLSNNARPSAVIEVPAAMGAEAQRLFLSQWDAMHQGIESAHKTAILTQGAKLHSFSINAKDAQLLETREFEIREMANWLDMPPHKLGDKSRSAYNTLEQENQAYLDESLDPPLVSWEEECRDKLLTEREKDEESHSIEFMRQALVRANLSERSASYASAITNGWMSRNEVRARENMNPYEGGDEFLTPLNMAPSSGAPVTTADTDEDDTEIEPVEVEVDSEDERTRADITEAFRRVTAHVCLYAKREAQQPKRFGVWLGTMRDKNLTHVADCLLPITAKLGCNAPNVVSRVLSELHGAFDVIYNSATQENFEAAITECVQKLETDLPTRWADELMKGKSHE